MAVGYTYIWEWKPPALTREQEIEIGRQISCIGRDEFLRRYPLSFDTPEAKRARENASKHGPLAIALSAIFFLAIFAALGVGFVVHNRLATSIVIAMVLGMAAMAGTMALAVYSRRRWVDKMMRRYAESVAASR